MSECSGPPYILPTLPCPALPCLPCPALLYSPYPALPCPAHLVLLYSTHPALPCPTNPALPYPALPYPTHPALPYPTLPCPTLPCPALGSRKRPHNPNRVNLYGNRGPLRGSGYANSLLSTIIGLWGGLSGVVLAYFIILHIHWPYVHHITYHILVAYTIVLTVIIHTTVITSVTLYLIVIFTIVTDHASSCTTIPSSYSFLCFVTSSCYCFVLSDCTCYWYCYCICYCYYFCDHMFYCYYCCYFSLCLSSGTVILHCVSSYVLLHCFFWPLRFLPFVHYISSCLLLLCVVILCWYFQSSYIYSPIFIFTSSIYWLVSFLVLVVYTKFRVIVSPYNFLFTSSYFTTFYAASPILHVSLQYFTNVFILLHYVFLTNDFFVYNRNCILYIAFNVSFYFVTLMLHCLALLFVALDCGTSLDIGNVLIASQYFIMQLHCFVNFDGFDMLFLTNLHEQYYCLACQWSCSLRSIVIPSYLIWLTCFVIFLNTLFVWRTTWDVESQDHLRSVCFLVTP